MRKRVRKVAAFVLVALLLLLLALPSASAAGATEVIINGVKLDASLPYWQNGSATASATVPVGGWNAYFDVSTSTLSLDDALADITERITGYPELTRGLVQSNGDLTLELYGTSTLVFSGGTKDDPYETVGFYVEGSLSVYGNGTINIPISTRYDVYGMIADGTLEIVSGDINITLNADHSCCGMMARRAQILIGGGNVDIQCVADECLGCYMIDDGFRMTGGNLSIQTQSTGTLAYGIDCSTISLEGGTTDVLAHGVGTTVASRYKYGNFVATGGNHVLAGDLWAIGRGYGTQSPDQPAAGMRVYVSEATDGRGKWQWLSSADGELAVYGSSLAPFHYVEFIYTPPATGDSSNPLLWAGIAVLCILLAAGTITLRRQRIQ
ncbi:MAG: LPXTG cell wall anchor domain-containing protein [Clostridiales bacterium]|nr:LPXTG cell wall anchor domain-containing protein [Clostridiales bacterium]